MNITLKKYILISAFILFVALYGFTVRFDTLPLRQVLGLILIAFLPGLLVNELFGLHDLLKLPAKIGFSVATSFAVVGLALLALKSRVPLTESNYIASILAINSILLLTLLVRRRFHLDLNIRKPDRNTLYEIGIALIPFLFFAVRSIINPYISDLDGAKYIHVFELVKNFHADNSFLSGGRPGFAPLVIAYNYLTGIELLTLFKYVLPGLTLISVMSAFAFKDISHRKVKFGYIYLLILLASPSVIGHIDRFKPETLIYLASTPIVILYFLATKKKSPAFYLLGLVYALAISRIHETGIILLVTYLMSGFVLAFLNYALLKRYVTPRNVILALLFLYPYFILYNPFKLLSILKHAVSLFTDGNLQFEFWFLDSYSSAGMPLGWPGWRFTLFYLFNGIFEVLLALYLLVTLLKRRIFPAHLLFPTFTFLVYLIISEILPRAGIFILPDRAWSQMFYNASLIVLAALYLSDLKLTDKANRLFSTILLINVICSLALTTYLAIDSGGLASRREKPGITAISALPQPAIILSTQQTNSAMIEFYGHKEFVYLRPADFTGITSFNDLQAVILQQINAGTITHNATYDYQATNTNTIKTTTTLFSYMEGGFTQTVSTTTTQTEQASEKASGPRIEAATPVYFMYSFAKDSNLSTEVGRPYIVNPSPISKELVATAPKENIIFEDNAVIILKVK